jgi:hypothetical protein
MTAAILALCLILSVLVWGVAMILVYELWAKRRADDDIFTISTWWDRLVHRRVVPRLILGVVLTWLFLFLFGDLVLELY